LPATEAVRMYANSCCGFMTPLT